MPHGVEGAFAVLPTGISEDGPGPERIEPRLLEHADLIDSLVLELAPGRQAYDRRQELRALLVIAAPLAAAYLAVGHWFKNKDWYRSAIVIPGSAAIALVGAYWAVERVLG